MNTFRNTLMLACATLLISSSAFATQPTNQSGNNNNNDADANAVAGATSIANGTGIATANGGAGGVASVDSRISNLTSNVNNVSSNQAQALVDASKHVATSVSNAQGGEANANVGDIYSPSSATANTGASTSGANSGGNTLSNTTNYDAQKRNPVSTAVAYGSAGDGRGMCRYGPGLGAQFVQFGLSASLPVFKDKDCKFLAYADFLLGTGNGEAAIQYLSANVPAINNAVTEARKHGNK